MSKRISQSGILDVSKGGIVQNTNKDGNAEINIKRQVKSVTYIMWTS